MRAKSKITESLSSKLTSDIWKKLKNSLLGRELIALGGEIISENENVKDTLLLQLNPDTADINGLYMLAQMNEVPITAKKPASLVVTMRDDAKTYAPFELKHNIGNQSFYNIEYTMQDKSVSLWHGTFKYYLHGNASADAVETLNGQLTDVTETAIYDGGESYTCMKLGNAYPDSISVKDENGVEFQRYTSDLALSDSFDLMYKVFTLNDGTQCVRFITKGETTPPVNFKIDWLDHSAGVVDYDDNTEIKINNTPVADINFSSQGEDEDIEFMRKQLKKEMAKYDGLNTPKSVERYVNSMPYVIDSKCAFDEKGGIYVYVKPSEDKPELNIYLDFSELAAHISLNSLLFPNIKVMMGKRLQFGLTISGLKDEAIKAYARQVIQDKYAYDKIGFSSAVNISEIVADIYGKYGVAPSISMTLRENFTVDEQLSYVPEKNSIRGFDVNDTTTMTENNGVLYSTLPIYDIMNLFDVVCCVGNMVLFRKYREYRKGVNSVEYKYYIDSQENEHVVNHYVSPVSDAYKNLDEFYLWDAASNTIKPFDESIDGLFSKTDLSLWTDGKGVWKTYDTTHLHVGQEAYNGSNYKGFFSIQDVEVLSTNNMVVLNFIMNSNGADKNLYVPSAPLEDEKYLTYVYNYYRLDTSRNTYLYNKEHNTDYQGHFQLSVCVPNNIFRNILSESWGNIYNVLYGYVDKRIDDGGGIIIENIEGALEGFYDGFKGYRQDGSEYTPLNLKANSFYFEGKLYYMEEITSSYVKFRNNVDDNVISISLSSALRGLVEQDGVLYVVQRNNITVVEGFSGIKQKNKTYTIYNGNNTFAVEDLVVGLNGNIMIKSVGGFYLTRKIVIRDTVSITFENLQKLFADKEDDTEFVVQNLIIGSCTSDYATCYKKTRDKPAASEDGATANSNLTFYCYDIKNKSTQSYNCNCTTTRYYLFSGSDGNTSYEIITAVDTNMGGEMEEIGIMNYDESKIEVSGTADMTSIATIQYNGITSNNKVDFYIVLNEDDIKFI